MECKRNHVAKLTVCHLDVLKSLKTPSDQSLQGPTGPTGPTGLITPSFAVARGNDLGTDILTGQGLILSQVDALVGWTLDSNNIHLRPERAGWYRVSGTLAGTVGLALMVVKNDTDVVAAGEVISDPVSITASAITHVDVGDRLALVAILGGTLESNVSFNHIDINVVAYD